VTKSRRTALISAPPFDRAVLEKLSGLLSDLGPVKAASQRMASRAANALRAGYPVRDWAEVHAANFLLVSAPPERMEALLGEMAAALEGWRNRIVVLVGGSLDGPGGAALARRRARVAAVHLLEATMEPLATIEGDSVAVREVRRRMASGTRLIVTRRGTATACRLAAANLQLSLSPTLDAAVSLLRHTGLSSVQAWRVVESYAQFTLRSFRRGGRPAVCRMQSGFEQRQIVEQLGLLRERDPHLADFVGEILTASLRYRGFDSGIRK